MALKNIFLQQLLDGEQKRQDQQAAIREALKELEKKVQPIAELLEKLEDLPPDGLGYRFKSRIHVGYNTNEATAQIFAEYSGTDKTPIIFGHGPDGTELKSLLQLNVSKPPGKNSGWRVSGVRFDTMDKDGVFMNDGGTDVEAVASKLLVGWTEKVAPHAARLLLAEEKKAKPEPKLVERALNSLKRRFG